MKAFEKIKSYASTGKILIHRATNLLVAIAIPLRSLINPINACLTSSVRNKASRISSRLSKTFYCIITAQLISVRNRNIITASELLQ